jgi:hypothetical protein
MTPLVTPKNVNFSCGLVLFGTLIYLDLELPVFHGHLVQLFHFNIPWN